MVTERLLLLVLCMYICVYCVYGAMVRPVRPELVVEGSGKFLEAQGGMAVAALDEKLFLSSLVFALLGFWRARAYKLAQSRVADHARLIETHQALLNQSFSRGTKSFNYHACASVLLFGKKEILSNNSNIFKKQKIIVSNICIIKNFM